MNVKMYAYDAVIQQYWLSDKLQIELKINDVICQYC